MSWLGMTVGPTMLPSPQRRNMEEVVIAGMSGKLPESENLQEFWANLIGGVDMVTDDDRRWKAGECPLRIRQQTRLRVYDQGTSWKQCLLRFLYSCEFENQSESDLLGSCMEVTKAGQEKETGLFSEVLSAAHALS